ncbi:MAG: hypothetical protein LC637_11245 [Xanthomonadaceae bacterium]|nr:hypothetical protein [Xanthomonadaceae bacterium]
MTIPPVFGKYSKYNAAIIEANRKILGDYLSGSTLDVAATGHPCIVIDPSLSKRYKPQSRFRFVSELRGFALGEFRDFPLYVEGIHSVSDVLQAVSCDNDLGESCMRYVEINHQPEKIFRSMLSKIENSTLKSKDISPSLEKIRKSYVELQGRGQKISRFLRLFGT